MWTHQQGAFALESYFRNGERNEDGVWGYNTNLALLEFRDRFPDLIFTEKQFRDNLEYLVGKFRETGSVVRRQGSGKTKRVRTEDKIAEVRQVMEEVPSTSLRRVAQEAGISRSTAHNIVKKDLQLFPYKVRSYHEIKPIDYPRRLEYCNWFNANLNNNDLLDKTFFSDEAWFHLSGYVNSQNQRMWSAENPHIFVETPLHSEKVGIFIAISRRRLIGPIFFEATVNGELYRNQLLAPVLEQLQDDELQEGYFQQDGATAHTAAASLAYLREFYDNRVISQGCEPSWPPRSPDLTPLDTFVFPYLKNNVFKQRVNNLDELRERIVDMCATITPQILCNVFENIKRRVNLCIQENGEHFEQYL